MSDVNYQTNTEQTVNFDATKRSRRRFYQCLFALIAALMIADAMPASFQWFSIPKQAARYCLQRAGLWQGEWSMFAPDPVINNGWFSADIELASGDIEHWDSPYWAEKGSLEKFRRAREMNYYNRLGLPWNLCATDDFADYLLRNSKSPARSIKLFKNQMQFRPDSEGRFLSHDETEWMFSTEIVTRKSAQP